MHPPILRGIICSIYNMQSINILQKTFFASRDMLYSFKFVWDLGLQICYTQHHHLLKHVFYLKYYARLKW